jgi:DNA (cytosine-5)-methyltransferase 1
VTGRPAPPPLETSRRGRNLNAAFSEWMMGLPAGWVTGVPCVTRDEQLEAIGRGVVPPAAELAITYLAG